jgi:hypothetical protein
MQQQHQAQIDAQQAAQQRRQERLHQQQADEAQRPHDEQAAQEARQSRRAARLSEARQQQLIQEQQQRQARYAVLLSQRQADADRLAAQLREQKRLRQASLYNNYLDRLRQQRLAVEQARYYDYNNDPYFYSYPTYRYSYGGRNYETSDRGADLLRTAVNSGYEEGYQAGQADRQDGWRFDYRNSYAYRDANYGYTGFYVNQDQYNYYFREGFQKGYEDGYYSRSQYGTVVNGKYQLIGSLLSTLLNLTNLR